MNGKNVFDMTIAELVAAGFTPRVIRVVKKNDGDDAANRELILAAFLGRAERPVAKKEFADVEFTRVSQRGNLVKTMRNMPLGMVPRGIMAAYLATIHGNSCQHAKAPVRTRFV